MPGAAALAEVSIIDDDPPPTVSFSLARSTVPEGRRGAGLPVAAVTVQLSTASAKIVTVPVSIIGGSATPSDDFTLIRNGSLVFAPGKTSLYAVMVLDDTVHEPSETVNLALGTPTNAALGAQTTHTLSIKDNDP